MLGKKYQRLQAYKNIANLYRPRGPFHFFVPELIAMRKLMPYIAFKASPALRILLLYKCGSDGICIAHFSAGRDVGRSAGRVLYASEDPVRVPLARPQGGELKMQRSQL